MIFVKFFIVLLLLKTVIKYAIIIKNENHYTFLEFSVLLFMKEKNQIRRKI